MKIISIALEDWIKKYSRFLLSSNQTAYAEGRFISGILFPDILRVTDFLKLRGLLVTVDTGGISFC